MADCPKSKIPPFDPDNLASDGKWVPMLDAPDQVEYWSARGAFETVKTAYESAVAVAQAALDKVKNDFQGLKDNWRTASLEVDEAIAAAEQSKGALADLVQGLDPAAATTTVAAMQQVTDLQQAVQSYGALLLNISAKVTARAAALDALKKASQPQPGVFDPEKAEINQDRLQLAEAQFRMAKDTARKPYTKGWDVLLQKRAVLYSHLDDQVPDSQLEAQSA